MHAIDAIIVVLSLVFVSCAGLANQVRCSKRFRRHGAYDRGISDDQVDEGRGNTNVASRKRGAEGASTGGGVHAVDMSEIAVVSTQKDGHSAEGFFLSGRSMNWILVGSSLFASNIGAEHFLGLSSSGAAGGIAVSIFEWNAAIFLLGLGWIFAPLFLESMVFTTPGFLEKRFNRFTRTFMAVTTIVLYILTKISGTIFGGSIVLKAVLGWNTWMSSLVVTCVTGLYTMTGGLHAVMWTDLIQSFIFIFGAGLVLMFSFREVGGLSGMKDALPESYFHMWRSASDPDLPWTGVLIGQPITSTWYWCFDNLLVQRVLAAKDISHARMGCVSAGYMKMLVPFLMVVPGMCAAVLFPDEIKEDPNMAYPLLVTRILPVGVVGVIVSSILASMMSSLSSIFNSSSALITMDMYKAYIRRNAGEKELVFFGRTMTVIVVILSICWIPIIEHSRGQMFLALQAFQSYLAAPYTVIFILGVFWKRANGWGAAVAIVVGFAMGMVRVVLEVVAVIHGSDVIRGSTNLGAPIDFVKDWTLTSNFMHFAILVALVSTSLLVVVSLMTSPPRPEQVNGITHDIFDIASEMLRGRALHSHNRSHTRVATGGGPVSDSVRADSGDSGLPRQTLTSDDEATRADFTTTSPTEMAGPVELRAKEGAGDDWLKFLSVGLFAAVLATFIGFA